MILSKYELIFNPTLLIETGTTKGGLDSADIWGEADDVSHNKLLSKNVLT